MWCLSPVCSNTAGLFSLRKNNFMSRQNAQQGIVKTLFAMAAMSSGIESVNHLQHASALLTNGYRAPIPGKRMNQRQQRLNSRRTNK